MKGMPALFYLGSSLDEVKGIRFRGLSIPEMRD
jgi:hypothetical protein